LGLSDVGLHPGLDDVRLLPGGGRVSDKWRQHAACKGKPLDWFYRVSDGHPYYEARHVCAKCPVQLECLEANLKEDHGFFGGTTPKERRRIIRQRRDNKRVTLASLRSNEWSVA
jgi:hypothetical protein